MALFKILKGSQHRLPTEYHEGYMYITNDTGLIYLDTTDTAEGRICLNGHAAEELRKIIYDDNNVPEVYSVTYDTIDTIQKNVAKLQDDITSQNTTTGNINTALEALRTAISTETTRAQGEESTIAGNLATEIQTREASEAQLAEDIAKNQDDILTLSTTLGGLTVQLTDDVTSAETTLSGQKIVVSTELKTMPAVVAGDYGPTVDKVEHGGTLEVPYITVDDKGRVTNIETKSIAMPTTQSIDDTLTAHNTQINVNKDAIAAQEASLSEAIVAEEARATKEEEDLSARVSVLEGNDTTQDASLTTINTTLGEHRSDIDANAAQLEVEAGLRADLEAALTAALNAEIERSGKKDTELDTEVSDFKTSYMTTIATIQGSDTSKSIRDVANEVVSAAFQMSEDYDGAIDTLTEIVRWINEEENGAITILSEHGRRIQQTEDQITSLQTNKVHNTAQVIAGTGLTGGGSFENGNITLAHASAFENGGAVGPTQDASLSWSGGFVVPQITYDQQGHITGISGRTISIPSNPDTDTHYTANLITGLSATSQENGDISAYDNNTVYLNLVENGVVRNSHKIVGSGATKVTSDANGNITISSTDTNTTYSAATTSAAGLMSAADKSKLNGIAAGANNYTYTLPAATASALGGVKVGSNITVSSGTISLTKANVTTALGYTPPTANTDTKNTTGTTNSTSILYLAGATSQAANPQTYSHSAIKANCNSSGTNEAGSLTATKIYGAVWNDFAEYRESNVTEPGRVICENGDDTLSLAAVRLQPGASIVSDTFGFAIGETETAKTPIAVAGRVLAYTYENRYEYKPGDAVCAAPGGTVSKMTREEIMMYPERIVGTVSAIPEYETWGENNVSINGRIWIKVK